MNTNQRPTVKDVPIIGLSHDGRGVAKLEGKTTFVFGSLTDEVADIEIVRTRENFDEAKTINIGKESAFRVGAKCEFFGSCGVGIYVLGRR